MEEVALEPSLEGRGMRRQEMGVWGGTMRRPQELQWRVWTELKEPRRTGGGSLQGMGAGFNFVQKQCPPRTTTPLSTI